MSDGPRHRRTGAPLARSVRSIERAAAWIIVALCVDASVPRCVGAQEPARRPDSAAVREPGDSVAQRRRAQGDSVRPKPPITPAGAFVRSLVLPGWGQSRLNRNMSAGLFVAFEGVALAMTWKSAWQLEYARARGKFVDSHEQELQDWIVLLFFNHLFSAAEAWVSANLYDFPEALRVRALPAPGGGTTIGVSVPLR